MTEDRFEFMNDKLKHQVKAAECASDEVMSNLLVNFFVEHIRMLLLVPLGLY